MSKIILNKISAPENVSLINDNFQKIANEFDEKVLYRKVPAQEPNQLLNDVDMNGKRLYNLVEPTADHEAARLIDVKDHSAGGQYHKTLRTPDDVIELPNADGRKGRLLSFDENGQPHAAFPASDSSTQLRMDLASSSGSSLVNYGATTVQDKLTSLTGDVAAVNSRVDVVAKATGVSAGGVTVGSVQAVLDATARSTRFKSAMDFKDKDPYLLLVGDSTGNEQWEFFYQTVLKIAAAYPTHTVLYRLWNDTTKTWDLSTIQTGTSGRTLRIHNGSVPGATSVYWDGVNKTWDYDGFQFDMVIVNYGLNAESVESVQESALTSTLYKLRREQPNAELVVCIQPPDYNSGFIERSRLRSETHRKVIASFGVACVDVFSLFTQLVNKTGNVSDWYIDAIHPNPAGQAKWADLLYGAIMNTNQSPVDITASDNLMPNGDFNAWYAGFPVYWTTNSTLTRESVDVESGQYAVKINGFGSSTGTFSVNADELMRKYQHLPSVTIMARVKSFGSSYKPGIVYMSTGSGGSYAEVRSSDNGVGGVGSGANRWVSLTVPRSFYYGKSFITIGMFSGEAGEYIIVDRMMISGSHVVPESNGQAGFIGSYRFDDSSFSINPNNTVYRNIGGGTDRFALKRGAKLTVRAINTMPDGMVLTATSISDETVRISFSNLSAASMSVPASQYIIEGSA